MNGAKPNRKRPVLHTTIGENTLVILTQVAKDIAMPNYGVTVDYIVNDWVVLKQTAIDVATMGAPSDKITVGKNRLPAEE
jgi:hypothetical protein